MAKAKLVALHAAQERARKQKGKTLVAVFTEKKDRKEKAPIPATREEIKKRVRKIQKAMMTTKNIVKEPENKAKEEPPHPHHKQEEKKEEPKPAKPTSIFKEEGVKRATHKSEPPHDNPATAAYLSPAQAAAKEARDTLPAQRGAESPPVVGALAEEVEGAEKPPKEDLDARILRVLKTARVRLQGRGMPELDLEVDELIRELEK